MKTLLGKRNWIFDLDGTLTKPVHDFAFIRRELAIPDRSDILGHLDTLEPSEAALRHARLNEIELELARGAEAAEGALSLIESLCLQGYRIGILTRNSREIALLTLEAIGVSHHFTSQSVIGREDAAPKPDPEGIYRLLGQWGGDADDAVMIGDYLFDLQAGKAAGAVTLHVGRPDGQRWPECTDFAVASLAELLPLFAAGET
jgi:HAD superfamily hydrolase (TIGR01549 family)